MRMRKALHVVAPLLLVLTVTSTASATPYSGQTGRHSSGTIQCTSQSVLLAGADVGPAAGSTANWVFVQHYLMRWNGASWVYVTQNGQYVTSPWYATYIHVALDSENWREYQNGQWVGGDGTAFIGVSPGYYTFQTWFYWSNSASTQTLGIAYDYPGTGSDYYCQVA